MIARNLFAAWLEAHRFDAAERLTAAAIEASRGSTSDGDDRYSKAQRLETHARFVRGGHYQQLIEMNAADRTCTNVALIVGYVAPEEPRVIAQRAWPCRWGARL